MKLIRLLESDWKLIRSQGDQILAELQRAFKWHTEYTPGTDFIDHVSFHLDIPDDIDAEHFLFTVKMIDKLIVPLTKKYLGRGWEPMEIRIKPKNLSAFSISKENIVNVLKNFSGLKLLIVIQRID